MHSGPTSPANWSGRGAGIPSREGDFPHVKYFVGGITNPTLNLLDRHVAQGNGNRVALIWEGEDGQARFFTYRMLLVDVNRCANVLRRLGVGKGDAVAIFTPNLSEAIVAVLACFRIGALFNTVFSGFSARSLRDRLESYAAEGGRHCRWGVPARNDRPAEGHCGCRDRRPAGRRGDGGDSSNRNVGGLARGSGSLVARSDARVRQRCALAEPMEANDPGIVFYTSGTTGKPKGIVHSGVAFVVNNYIYAKYHLDHHPDDVLWCTADIGWLTLHIWGIVGALANGVTTVVFEGALDFPTRDRFYQIVERYQVNKIFTAPTAVRMLMRLR